MSETGTEMDRLVGARIEHERERAGLSRAELAARAQLLVSELEAVEQGYQRPQAEVLLDLANRLGVPLSELMKPAGA